jgi:peptide/nickel transport system ATP-binding protein
LPILALKELKVEYASGSGTVAAVDRGTFDVSKGQVVGLVGESGCGKTTLARAIIGVMSRNAKIVGGEMLFEERDLAPLKESQKRDVLWREIAFIPQSAMNALDPVYRVSAQIREVLVERGGYKTADVKSRIDELFRIVGLDPGRQHDYPHQFSGGMRQRVGIEPAGGSRRSGGAPGIGTICAAARARSGNALVSPMV